MCRYGKKEEVRLLMLSPVCNKFPFSIMKNRKKSFRNHSRDAAGNEPRVIVVMARCKKEICRDFFLIHIRGILLCRLSRPEIVTATLHDGGLALFYIFFHAVAPPGRLGSARQQSAAGLMMDNRTSVLYCNSFSLSLSSWWWWHYIPRSYFILTCCAVL